MTNEEKVAKEREYISKFMEYFSENQLQENDPEIVEFIKENMTKVFQLEVEEMGYHFDPNKENNTFSLEFVSDEDKSWSGVYNHGDVPSVKINLFYSLLNLYSPDQESRLNGCRGIFKTLFHELQHHRQNLMAMSSVSSLESLRYARDFACHLELGDTWYSRDAITGNYDSYITENNANEVGYGQFAEIMGDDDITINLRNIERGRVNLSRYKIDMMEENNHLYSNGLKERDEVTGLVLDKAIVEDRKTWFLDIYPILKKEYTEAGKKKSAVELITEMKKEIQNISEDHILTDEQKQELISDAQEMYYELIYRQIEKMDEQGYYDLITEIGQEQSIGVVDDISNYFKNSIEYRIDQSEIMAKSQEANPNTFIPPYNEGWIEIEQDGESRRVNPSEFIETLDQDLASKVVKKTYGPDKGEISGRDTIKKYIFATLPASGIVTLKSGEKVSAKEYVEQYILEDLSEITPQNPITKLVSKTMQSEDPWVIHEENKERLECKGEQIQQNLVQIKNRLAELSPKKVNEAKEEIKNKKALAKEFLHDYEITEDETLYGERVNFEKNDLKKVIECIKTRSIRDVFYNETDTKNMISIMARLLKSADNMTLEYGRDIFEEFIRIPEVGEKLQKIQSSEERRLMHDIARKNENLGTLSNHPKTMAEQDKEIAQDWTQKRIDINDSADGNMRNEMDKIIGDAQANVRDGYVTLDSKSDFQYGRNALIRVVSRQEGFTPTEVLWDDNIGYHYYTDENMKGKIDTSKIVLFDEPESFSLDGIENATSAVSMKEIEGIVQYLIEEQAKKVTDNKGREESR